MGLVGMLPWLSGWLGSVRQKSQPMEQPWDHQRQGWPPPPFSRAEPSSQGPLLAQVQPVDLLLPFWNPSTTRSNAFRLVGILQTFVHVTVPELNYLTSWLHVQKHGELC